MRSINIPVSWGEFIDKITILEIKCQRIADEVSLKNVLKELSMLNDLFVIEESLIEQILMLKERLYQINSFIWEVESALRQKEVTNEFDEEFIKLARSVYINNDKRYCIKKEINKILNSDLVEEKSHKEDLI